MVPIDLFLVLPFWGLSNRRFDVTHFNLEIMRGLVSISHSSMAAAVTYEVKSQARTLAAVEGDADRSRFIVGTLNLRVQNELHVVEFSEDANEFVAIAVYAAPHEALHLAACPAPAHAHSLLTVCNDGGATHYVALSSVPVLDPDDLSTSTAKGVRPALPERARLVPSPGSAGAHGLIRSCLWSLADDAAAAATVQPGALCLWPLEQGQTAPSPSSSYTADAAFGAAAAGAAAQSIEGACWDPHHTQTMALGSAGGAVCTVDLRTMRRAAAIAAAHRGCVRVLQFNPNKPHALLTAADDGAIRFWDLRKAGALEATAPSGRAGGTPPAAASTARLGSLDGAHAHWTCCAAFNRFHDQLVLSAGTDTAVKLWRQSAVSSAPPVAESHPDEEDADADADGLVREYADHDESVYGLVWSAADAWLFASLSLDGKLCAHYVPAATKYQILLVRALHRRGAAPHRARGRPIAPTLLTTLAPAPPPVPHAAVIEVDRANDDQCRRFPDVRPG
jgi:hypothetical protein